MKLPLQNYASSDGYGGGTTNLNGNYATATKFTVQCNPAVHEYLTISRLIISIEDDGTMDSGGYGSITPTAALTNGVEIYIEGPAGKIADLTPEPIKYNAQWASVCHDLSLHSFGSGNELLTARWTFTKYYGEIHVNADQWITVQLHDNLSTITGHKFLFEGVRHTA
jgi:hypothetical protein